MVSTLDHTTTTAKHTKAGDPKRENARRLYCEEGLGASDIAKRLNVKVKTLRGWICRYQWATKRSVVNERLMASASRTATEIGEAMAKEAGRWSQQSANDAKRLRGRAMRFLDSGDGEEDLAIDEVKSLVATIGNIDSMARKALGLDNVAPSVPGTLVNISLSGASLAAPIGAGQVTRPIDVESSAIASD